MQLLQQLIHLFVVVSEFIGIKYSIFIKKKKKKNWNNVLF